ncbi:MAG: SDR family NAD(P)-dependent oxidoreductase [SAR202 cluster bacterium]|nr:SDR family NAD(P)-dependent oxidoreductase [SAR202 cluster bacterium]
MGKLDGKVAVVTGASRGIGRDIAVVFAREGAKVVVSARTENEGDFRIPGSIGTTVRRIRDAGGDAIGVKCDVSDEAQVEALVKQTMDRHGRLDILVNNAAILIPGKVEEMQIRHWDLLYRVNIRGPFLGCKFALPVMKRQRYGHILNISSTGAIGPGPGPYKTAGGGGIAYGAGKAHLERFTQGLAQEVWEENIAVNALSPRKGIASEGQRWFRGNTRTYVGAREDGEIMGDAAVYICAQDPRTCTGRILYDEDVLKEAGVTDLSKYALVTA